MEIIFFIIGAVITFMTKDKRFPNYPILGWLICTLMLAVGLYNSIDNASRNAAFNAGYMDTLK